MDLPGPGLFVEEEDVAAPRGIFLEGILEDILHTDEIELRGSDELGENRKHGHDADIK